MLVNRVDLAKLLRVAPRTVDQYVAQGMPVYERTHGQGRPNIYNLSDVDHWRLRRRWKKVCTAEEYKWKCAEADAHYAGYLKDLNGGIDEDYFWAVLETEDAEGVTNLDPVYQEWKATTARRAQRSDGSESAERARNGADLPAATPADT